MSRALVAYFSATGTTRKAAEALASAVDGDLFEIEPLERYTSADLNWRNPSSRSSLEMKDDAARPAIARTVENMGDYDLIFVGFPIWWYVEPRVIDTFLESHDFSDKTILPFATSGGSGLGQAPQRMASLAPGATVEDGKLLNRTPDAATLRAWARNLNL